VVPIRLSRGSVVIFQGWKLHQGVHQDRITVRFFFYICGGLHYELSKGHTGTSIVGNQTLIVQDSLMPGAGKGVFTTKEIKKGDTITVYEGVEVNRTYLNESDSDKKLIMNGHCFIGLDDITDADSLGVGSMINRHNEKNKNNCSFGYHSDLNKVVIKAAKDIKLLHNLKVGRKTLKVAELYIPYGLSFKC
jgi:hypothetical protein